MSDPLHIFTEFVTIQFSSQGMLYASFKSGDEATVFVMTPDMAKQVSKLFTKQVLEYERVHGPIVGRLPNEPMLSPIQPEDLRGGPSGL